MRADSNTRYALWKNPENLTDRHREKLAWIAKTDPRLHRAYPLKEGLRYVFAVKHEAGKQALDRWLSWACRCRIPAFIHSPNESAQFAHTSTPRSSTAYPTRSSNR
jgi:transposase